MPWQDVRPSVCLSVRPTHAGIMSKQLYISSKFSRHRVAPAFQFFFTPNGMAIFRRGPPLRGASNAREYEKNHDFQPISRCIWQTMQDRAIVTMEGE